MTDSLIDTRAVKDLLMKVSGLDQDGGNLRVIEPPIECRHGRSRRHRCSRCRTRSQQHHPN